MRRLSPSLLAVSVALAAITATGGKAWAWSPLQYDCASDVESRFDDPTIEFSKQAQSDNSDKQATKAQTTKSETTKTKEGALADGKDSEDSAEPQPAKEIKPAPKAPGIHPTELTKDPSYFYKRSQGFLRLNDYQSALNYINRALELQPEYWEAWYQKALTYQLAGYDAAAARRYLWLIEHKPDMPEAHIALGSLYRKHGNLDLAKNEYQAVIDLNYFSFAGHYNLANVLMDEKNLEQALKEYQVCLKMQPNNALVHNNIGVIYQQRNYLEEAASEFKTASHLEPANTTFVQNYSNVQTLLGQKTDKAIQL